MGSNQEYINHKQFQILTVGFEGHANFYDMEGSNAIEFSKREYDVVSRLERETYRISHEIEDELARLLPPSVKVQVQLHFRHGSIIWTGIIVIITAMGMINDVIDFTDNSSSVIGAVIDGIARKWIYTSDPSAPLVRSSTTANRDTDFNFPPSRTVQPAIDEYMDSLRRLAAQITPPTQFANLVRLNIATFLIVVIILILLIWQFFSRYLVYLPNLFK